MKTWLQCDKGWIGIPMEHRSKMMMLAGYFLFDGPVQIGNTIPLHKMMEWAYDNDIDYEVTMVKPEIKRKTGVRG